MSARGASRSKKQPASAGDAKILDAVRALGFEDFRGYLVARTVKPNGTTWVLVEMADELKVGRSAFIGFHTRWVKAAHGSVMP
jgi:hypothetical protein